ncbi:site-specific integrase [Pseudomonas rossensis]|uniref:site-specific integrase n=1 Tax=Pseudomonas rossensis TaxID=2305471 RepID=UPI003260854F
MASLTTKTVEKIIRVGLAGMTNDGDGLYLKVGRSGGASWIFRYKIAGKSRDMGLGGSPEVSLANAREKAAEARKLRTLEKAQDLSAKALHFTILTACRTSEVPDSTWAEIDLVAGIWTIPASRMKAGKEHRVPLSQAALDLLIALPRVKGNNHLFPGARKGRPLSNMAMLMVLRRMKRNDLTTHGFRSTFRDWASAVTHYPREVCEQALAHAVESAVEAAYRRGDLFGKRQMLMDHWSRYVCGIQEAQDSGTDNNGGTACY